jgi:hypothetical protein
VVDIHVPQLNDADASRLAQRLTTDPGLIARLLNRELDPAVLKEATALGLQVFPRRWKELQMECSCLDWAVPCKHPIDLQTLLGQHGGAVDAEAERALPAGALALFEDDPESAMPEPLHDPDALRRIDFTAVPELCDPLWRLLPAQPVFHHGASSMRPPRPWTSTAGRRRCPKGRCAWGRMPKPVWRSRAQRWKAGRWTRCQDC